MKIAFTAKGTTWEALVDPRFGRTDYIVLFDEDTGSLASVDNTAVTQVAHGAGPLTAKKLFELKPDVLITGNGPGEKAEMVLAETRIQTYTGAGNMTVKEAYTAFMENSLQRFS